MPVTFHPADVKVGQSIPFYTLNQYIQSELGKGGKLRVSSVEENSRANPITGLVNICIRAYSKHHKLVIRPEDVWFAIQSQFSIFVNEYTEALRYKFVSHEGKKDLVITEGEVCSRDMNALVLGLINKMPEYLIDPSLTDWILPKFTTTTFKDNVVFSLLAMSTLKNYFKYGIVLECGLPEVTLLGEVSDWEEIRSRADKLLEFEVSDECYMEKWHKMLTPVLDKFVESAKGNPDLDWWNKIASYICQGSGSSDISGWITVFNVFADNGEWLGDNKFHEFKRIKNNEWPIISTADIVSGQFNVNVLLDDNGNKINTKFFGGHMSADIIGDSDTMRPRLDWAMYEFGQS